MYKLGYLDIKKPTSVLMTLPPINPNNVMDKKRVKKLIASLKELQAITYDILEKYEEEDSDSLRD